MKNKFQNTRVEAGMWFFCISALLCCAPVFSESGQSIDSVEAESITNRLLQSEAKRLTAPTQFSNELKSLSEVTDAMTSYQQCHYNFLKNYELAYQGEMKAATKSLLVQLENCEDPRANIRIHAMLANIFVIKGKFEKSIKHIDSAIENAEQINDTSTKALAYSSASIVYNLLKQSDLSEKYSQLLYQLEFSESNLCNYNYYQLSSEILNADIDDETNIDRAVDMCLKTNNQVLAYLLVISYSQSLLEQRLHDSTSLEKVNQLLSPIEDKVNKTGYKNLQALFYATKSKLELMLKNYVEAKQLAQYALKLNKEIGDSDQYIIALDVLEKVSLFHDNYQVSYQYLKEKSEAEKRIFDLNQAKQMAFMTVKHDNFAKELEIDHLNKQNEVLELEKLLSKEQSDNQRLWIILILTIFAFLLLWLIKMKKRYDYFKDVSEIDHLTKVLTRKAFEDQVAEMIAHMELKQAPLHLAIMDLDHFKSVNDNHGHLIGDWVLKNVIYACKDYIEAEMIIARLGGEEFCIVVPEIAIQAMIDKVEAMRLAIESLDCTDSGAEFSVTASFGVSSSDTSGYNLNNLLTHADVALFEAKNQGRNQVVVYNPDKSPKTTHHRE